jgi:hypothetical protein
LRGGGAEHQADERYRAKGDGQHDEDGSSHARTVCLDTGGSIPAAQ